MPAASEPMASLISNPIATRTSAFSGKHADCWTMIGAGADRTNSSRLDGGLGHVKTAQLAVIRWVAKWACWPLGPAGGASQLPGQDEIGTAELTSQIKGRDMMIDRYADLLHVEH